MIKFIDWLNKQYCSENIIFWLETQIFKYLKDDDEILAEIQRIYEQYLVSNSLNLDEPIILEELKQKLKLPDRTVFMRAQNAIWALLKHECFPKFKIEIGKNMIEKVGSKDIKKIEKSEPRAIQLYDQFFDLTKNAYDNLDDFKPTTLPNDEYDEHLHQDLPEIDEIWYDRDLMFAFREYLSQQMANDSLSFYMDALNFENFVQEDDIANKAQEIYDKYFGSEATTAVDLEHAYKTKIEKIIKKKTHTREMYIEAKDLVYMQLKNQWFPIFYHLLHIKIVTMIL
jgi:hypothetical protein